MEKGSWKGMGNSVFIGKGCGCTWAAVGVGEEGER